MEEGQAQPLAQETKEEPKKKKKISKAKLVGIIIVIIIIWFGAVQYMAAERYDAVVNVLEGKDKMGVNPTTELLDFGDLSRETAQTRTVTLKNTGKMSKFIQVWKRGEIAEIMTVSASQTIEASPQNTPDNSTSTTKILNNNFVLKQGEELKIEFTVKIPSSAEYRKYEGKVTIFKWPKIW